jgi:hypothetical protein
MKKILFLFGVIILAAAPGCLIAEGGHGHGRRGGHSTIIVPAPVIVAPAVRVHVE